ncbi:MAG: hypothetical protein DRP89_05530, partial [Candidatus Neomarinimicrobiota bacterium]
DKYNKMGIQGIPGNDRPGDYRKTGTEFQPMEYTSNYLDLNAPDKLVIYYDGETEDYYQFTDSGWQEVPNAKIDKLLEDKAYIDMPNQSFFTFLEPRDIYFGMTVSFDLR